jgi:hypothetical protein
MYLLKKKAAQLGQPFFVDEVLRLKIAVAHWLKS